MVNFLIQILSLYHRMNQFKFLNISKVIINKHLKNLLNKKKCRIQLLEKGKWDNEQSYSSTYYVPILKSEYETDNNKLNINVKNYNCIDIFNKLKDYFK